MVLADEVSDFRRSLKKTLDSLKLVDKQANSLFSCSVEDLDSHLSRISSTMEEAQSHLSTTQVQLQDIGRQWGGATFYQYIQKLISTAQIGASLLTGIAAQSAKVVIPFAQDVAIPVLEIKDRLDPPQLEEIDQKSPLDKSVQDLMSHYETLRDDKQKNISEESNKKKKKG